MARRPKSGSDRRGTGEPVASGEVRIIGGVHRGRRLKFPDLPGLRPTGDRVKETLFNWLQPSLPGAACLDLFAGSGALGLEAASRGAGFVMMLDSAPAAVGQIRENAAMLGLESIRVEQGRALERLERPPPVQFDLVFLDPPFGETLLADVFRLLAEGAWLRPGALVYVEMDARQHPPAWPPDWTLLKQKRAGQVSYSLFETAY